MDRDCFQASPTRQPQSRRRATFAAKVPKRVRWAGFHGRGSSRDWKFQVSVFGPPYWATAQLPIKLGRDRTAARSPLAVNMTRIASGSIFRPERKELRPLRQEPAHLCDSLGLGAADLGRRLIAMSSRRYRGSGAQVTPPPPRFLQSHPHARPHWICCAASWLASAHVMRSFAGSARSPLADSCRRQLVRGVTRIPRRWTTGGAMSTGLRASRTRPETCSASCAR